MLFKKLYHTLISPGKWGFSHHEVVDIDPAEAEKQNKQFKVSGVLYEPHEARPMAPVETKPEGMPETLPIPPGDEATTNKVGGELNPEPETFTHKVTQETLDMNPDMAAQGVKAGDEIQVPLHEDQPLPDEIQATKDEVLKSQAEDSAPVKDDEVAKSFIADVSAAIDNGDIPTKNQAAEPIDGNTEVPDPNPANSEAPKVADTNVGEVPKPEGEQA